MALRFSIENETSLPDGGPLSVTVSGKRGLDIGRDQHLDWTLPDPTRTVLRQALRGPLPRRRLLVARRVDQRDVSERQRPAPAGAASPPERRPARNRALHHRGRHGRRGRRRSVGAAEPAAPSLGSSEFWSPLGEAAAPVPRRDLQPARETRPVRPDFLDWAVDAPPRRPRGQAAAGGPAADPRHGLGAGSGSGAGAGRGRASGADAAPAAGARAAPPNPWARRSLRPRRAAFPPLPAPRRSAAPRGRPRRGAAGAVRARGTRRERRRRPRGPAPFRPGRGHSGGGDRLARSRRVRRAAGRPDAARRGGPQAAARQPRRIEADRPQHPPDRGAGRRQQPAEVLAHPRGCPAPDVRSADERLSRRPPHLRAELQGPEGAPGEDLRGDAARAAPSGRGSRSSGDRGGDRRRQGPRRAGRLAQGADVGHLCGALAGEDRAARRRARRRLHALLRRMLRSRRAASPSEAVPPRLSR